MAGYKPSEVLIILLTVKLHNLVFEIIVLKQPNVRPVPTNIYILKYYGLDYISYTGFIRGMEYKPLLGH